jgi:hypothetical protein
MRGRNHVELRCGFSPLYGIRSVSARFSIVLHPRELGEEGLDLRSRRERSDPVVQPFQANCSRRNLKANSIGGDAQRGQVRLHAVQKSVTLHTDLEAVVDFIDLGPGDTIDSLDRMQN